MRGLDRAALMLETVAATLPRLGVDRARGAAALDGGALATDEVMRRVEQGAPFRTAYRAVKDALGRGERFSPPAQTRLVARRGSTGGLGDLGLRDIRVRIRRARTWNTRERRRFSQALRALAGRTAPLPGHAAAPPSP